MPESNRPNQHQPLNGHTSPVTGCGQPLPLEAVRGSVAVQLERGVITVPCYVLPVTTVGSGLLRTCCLFRSPAGRRVLSRWFRCASAVPHTSRCPGWPLRPCYRHPRYCTATHAAAPGLPAPYPAGCSAPVSGRVMLRPMGGRCCTRAARLAVTPALPVWTKLSRRWAGYWSVVFHPVANPPTLQ